MGDFNTGIDRKINYEVEKGGSIFVNNSNKKY